MIGTAFLLAAFCVAGALVFTGRQERRDYENYVASAEKYLEELDYESAQDAYLKAIEVDPSQADAYVGLAKTYLKQEDFDKAREILSQGQKSVSKEEAKRLISSGSDNGESGNPDNGSSIADEIDRLQVGKNYTWVVDPEIQADDIYYLKDENVMDYCRNDLNRQMETAYAVMKKDGKYGLIGLDGTMGAELEYQGIGTLSRFYEMEREEPVYEPEFGTMMTDYYFVEEEKEVKPAVAVIGDAGSYLRGSFYYLDGLRNTAEYHVGQWSGMDYQKKPVQAIPIKQSEVAYDGASDDKWWKNLDGNYAICDPDGNLVTDFIYEECGSEASGLLAVKQGGKWGYVNRQGEEVIPVEYDPSWRYQTYVFSYDTSQEPEQVEYCYAATDGYVPLCKGEEWELRDEMGELVIPSGIFDAIRPVHEGKCWVKKDGYWGVIQLNGYEADDSKDWSAASSQEIGEAVVEHLEDLLLEEGEGSFSVFESETTETDTQYEFLVRYSMSEEAAQEIIDSGGAPSANVLAGRAVIDKQTMEAVYWDAMDQEVDRWILE